MQTSLSLKLSFQGHDRSRVSTCVVSWQVFCLFTCRYGPGQSFGKHVDDSVEIGNGVYTEYTLLIYLTGAGTPLAKSKQKGAANGSPGLVGGETIFYGMLHLVGTIPQHCSA